MERTRRQFVMSGAAGVAGAFAIARPALADHITEPQYPLLSMTLDLYRYPDRTTLLRKDGTDKVTFANLRIEPRVTWERTATKTTPSEHYTVRIGGRHGRIQNGQFRAAATEPGWDDLWHHQNAPPHHLLPVYEVTQTNFYVGLLGWYEVFCEITGEESGAFFSERVLFERVA